MTRLEEIEARVARLEPGPWACKRGQYGPELETESGTWRGEVNQAVWDCDDYQDGCPDIQTQWVDEGNFIAHARSDIPWLLAEVKWLREKWRRDASLVHGEKCYVEPPACGCPDMANNPPTHDTPEPA